MWKMAAKLTDCCVHGVACVHSETEEAGYVPIKCRSRLCETCAKERAFEYQSIITDCVKVMDQPRFLTLTLRGTSATLATQLRRLKDAWSRLRRSKYWARRATGGVYTIEVTWSTEHQAWHPHIHAVVDAKWLDQQELRDAWYRLTTDSYIVHIEQVHSRADLARRLCHYLAKTGQPLKIPNARIPEFAASVASLRMLQTFGSLHGHRLREPKEPGEGRMQIICPLWRLKDAAKYGDIVALNLHTQWLEIDQLKTPDERIDLAQSTIAWCEQQGTPP